MSVDDSVAVAASWFLPLRRVLRMPSRLVPRVVPVSTVFPRFQVVYSSVAVTELVSPLSDLAAVSAGLLPVTLALAIARVLVVVACPVPALVRPVLACVRPSLSFSFAVFSLVPLPSIVVSCVGVALRVFCSSA